MSAICGVWNTDGRPVDASLLERMIAVGYPFGPDVRRKWTDGPVGLGFCGLLATDEDMADIQPRSKNESYIVWDGQIDNREDLARDLGSNGVRSLTDSGYALASYEAWGADCAKRILGDFAFAIWDLPNRRFLCARDALGVRPLFYSFDGKTLICGSLLRQVLQGRADKSLTLNEEYIANFLVRGDCPDEATPFPEIKRLMPGQLLVSQAGTLKKVQYWNLDPHAEIQYEADREYEEQFRYLFRKAVRVRLRSKGAVAAQLSGGLDSSSIVCLTQEIYRDEPGLNRGLRVYTDINDQATKSDERNWSKSVAEKYGLEVTHFRRENTWTLKDQGDQDLYWDEPTPKGLCLASFRALGNQMLEDRAKILLSGTGGDQVFCGNSRHAIHLADYLRKFQWGTLVRELAAWQPYLKKPFPKVVMDNCVGPLLHPNSTVVPSCRSTATVPSWIRKGFSEKYGLRGRAITFLPRRYSSPALQNQYQMIKRTSAVLVQGHLIDPPVYVRYPFLDRDLVEFAMVIPMEQKLRPGGDSRSIVRRGMRGILPEKIRNRTGKVTTDHSEYLSLLHERQRLEQWLPSLRLASMGYVDAFEFQHAFELALVGHSQNLYLFFVALSLELWLRAFESAGRTGSSFTPDEVPTSRSVPTWVC